MPDQPRQVRSRRSPVLLLLGLLGALTLAAMLAGDAFGSAPGGPEDGTLEAGGALNQRAVGQPAQGGQLAVEYTFPAQNDVEVDSQANVLVQFNRPVAPLTALAQRSTRSVLAFDPPVTGAGHWLTSSLYVFRPDALQPNAHYSV